MNADPVQETTDLASKATLNKDWSDDDTQMEIPVDTNKVTKQSKPRNHEEIMALREKLNLRDEPTEANTWVEKNTETNKNTEGERGTTSKQFCI